MYVLVKFSRTSRYVGIFDHVNLTVDIALSDRKCKVLGVSKAAELSRGDFTEICRAFLLICYTKLKRSVKLVLGNWRYIYVWVGRFRRANFDQSLKSKMNNVQLLLENNISRVVYCLNPEYDAKARAHYFLRIPHNIFSSQAAFAGHSCRVNILVNSEAFDSGGFNIEHERNEGRYGDCVGHGMRPRLRPTHRVPFTTNRLCS